MCFQKPNCVSFVSRNLVNQGNQGFANDFMELGLHFALMTSLNYVPNFHHFFLLPKCY